jgi:hypothetical protein
LFFPFLSERGKSKKKKRKERNCAFDKKLKTNSIKFGTFGLLEKYFSTGALCKFEIQLSYKLILF